VELQRKDEQLFARDLELKQQQREMETMRERIEKLEAAVHQRPL
jgi:hypothetical protein